MHIETNTVVRICDCSECDSKFTVKNETGNHTEIKHSENLKRAKIPL